MKLLSEREEYIFEWDESDSLIKFTWKEKYLSCERFKRILHLFTRYVDFYKPKFLFVDARKSKVTMTHEVQEWHDLIIVPRYLKAQVKAIAFINPESIFAEITHKKMFERNTAKKELRISFFKTEEEAQFWFMQLSAGLIKIYS